MNEQERRRLFFASMRHPEMRVLREALQHLHIDQGIDWRAIQCMGMFRYGTDDSCWMMITDRLVVACLCPDKPDLGIYDFSTYHTHVEDDPACKCDVCREEVQR